MCIMANLLEILQRIKYLCGCGIRISKAAMQKTDKVRWLKNILQEPSWDERNLIITRHNRLFLAKN